MNATTRFILAGIPRGSEQLREACSGKHH